MILPGTCALLRETDGGCTQPPTTTFLPSSPPPTQFNEGFKLGAAESRKAILGDSTPPAEEGAHRKEIFFLDPTLDTHREAKRREVEQVDFSEILERNV